MQKNFINENFEDFLKQNADQLKLTPSVKAWKGIEKRLSTRRRWSALLASAFILSASLFGYLSADNTKTFFGPKPLASQDNTENAQTSAPAGGKVIPIERNSRFGQSSENINTDNQLTSSSVLTTEGNDEVGALLFLNDATNDESLTLSPVSVMDKFAATEQLAVPFTNRPDHFLSIANVAKAVKAVAKKRKTDLEFYFTPTFSYRKLTENKSYLRSLPNNGFNYVSYYDVKNVVTHRPHIGLEFGAAFKYRVARAVNLKAGLQFNMSGYEIKAYDNTPEIATIALNTNNRVQSVNTISNYRNFYGAKSDWIKNSYFQVSAPVGAEVFFKNTKKIRVGAATTVQPTYMLGDKAYLLSSDYKNYSQVPWLMRKWNVNTSVETFVGYSTGKLKWQIGPQVRYQLLSSFVSKYSVKENLIDVGLKVGVSLNNK